MDTLTIDVRGLPDEKVRELEQMVELWMQREQPRDDQTEISPVNHDVNKRIQFSTHKSHIIGKVTRAAAYEHE